MADTGQDFHLQDNELLVIVFTCACVTPGPAISDEYHYHYHYQNNQSVTEESDLVVSVFSEV